MYSNYVENKNFVVLFIRALHVRDMSFFLCSSSIKKKHLQIFISKPYNIECYLIGEIQIKIQCNSFTAIINIYSLAICGLYSNELNVVNENY